MKLVKIFLLTLTGLLLMSALVLADSGRIYGKIVTVDGDEFQGPIRWDKNEGSWIDILDGNKNLDKHKRSSRKKYSRDRDRDATIELFGISINTGRSSVRWSSSAQSGIKFGHIKTLKVINDDDALLTLKNGNEVEILNSSTDIGSNVREIVIEDEREGELELVWDDIDYIEFMDSNDSYKSNFGERLYGTLTTRRGDEFTGYICWDIDEIFTNDILDGDYKGRRRKIKFGKIQSIERYSSSGAKVILKNDDEMVLKGTNDVNSSNSGIIVSDIGFGQVVVDWNEFDKLVFHEPDGKLKYSQFDGGKALYGTVYTEDGDELVGKIRWDNDEEYTWEILDGNYRKVEFDIEFGQIKSIEKRSYRSAIVTVWDDRSFTLKGSNDVDEDNKGIFILLDDGEEVEVDWEDFERVEFKK